MQPTNPGNKNLIYLYYIEITRLSLLFAGKTINLSSFWLVHIINYLVCHRRWGCTLICGESSQYNQPQHLLSFSTNLNFLELRTKKSILHIWRMTSTIICNIWKEILLICYKIVCEGEVNQPDETREKIFTAFYSSLRVETWLRRNDVL